MKVFSFSSFLYFLLLSHTHFPKKAVAKDIDIGQTNITPVIKAVFPDSLPENK